MGRSSAMLSVFLVSLSLAPAAPVPPGQPAPAPVYFPTQVGATWEYQDGKDAAETYRVPEVETKDGVRIVSVARVKDGGKESVEEKVTVSDKGVFRIEYLGIKIDPPVCILKLPIRAGDSWERRLVGKSKVVCTVRGTEKVAVPAGTYEAVVIDSETTYLDGSTAKQTMWYAAGVGRVKLDYGGSVPRSEVMKAFTPGK